MRSLVRYTYKFPQATRAEGRTPEESINIIIKSSGLTCERASGASKVHLMLIQSYGPVSDAPMCFYTFKDICPSRLSLKWRITGWQQSENNKTRRMTEHSLLKECVLGVKPKKQGRLIALTPFMANIILLFSHQFWAWRKLVLI